MKDIPWSKLFRKIGILYLCFFVFCIGLVLLLRHYSGTKYSESDMVAAMTATSRMRDITGDPCLYSILGDPISAEDMYAKVNIYCPGGKHSNNSIDLRVVKGNSVFDLFKEVGRINGFIVSYDKKIFELGDMKSKGDINTWNCFIGTEKISDFDKPVNKSSTVECFYGMTTKEIDLIRNGKN